MSSAKRLIFVSIFNRSSSSLPEAPGGARPCGRAHFDIRHGGAWMSHQTAQSHTNAAAGEDYAHNRRRRTASRGIRKLASPNRPASDLTESGTKLRSRVLHLKVAVVELPVKVVHEGGCGRETQDRRRKCVRNSVCFASLCASPDPVVTCPGTGHSTRVSPSFAQCVVQP